MSNLTQVEMVDITHHNASFGKQKKRKVEDSDSDLELEVDSISQGKRRRSGDGKSIPAGNKGKGRASTSNEGGPSDAVFATWSRGDDDMEPSTKMNKMIELLKKWEAMGDKSIIYSQCTFSFVVFSKLVIFIDRINRDLDARPYRASVLSSWYSNTSFRWKDGQSD